MLRDEDILEEVTVHPGAIKVKTPFGMCNVVKAYKTKPLRTITLYTENYKLTAAEDHLIATPVFGEIEMRFLPIKILKVGEYVQTETGVEQITKLKPHDKPETLYDFEVDHTEHCYYTDGVLSHNSTGLGCRQLIFTNIIPKHRSLYIAPHSQQASTYAHRLEEMYRAFKYQNKGGGLKKNLYRKEFSNGALIEIVHALTSADSVRGRTADELLFDEVQNMDAGLEPDIQQVQKASKNPITMYAGTSLTLDTMLEAKWENSSKGTWHIHAGGKWLNTGDKESVLKMIGPTGLINPKTGYKVDPTIGMYVHEDQQMEMAGQIGLHIPQIIIPEYTNDILKWDEIYQDFVDYSEAKFLQEVIGIPVEEANRELTKTDLVRCCISDVTDQNVDKLVASGRYKYIVSGCDWGGSDYNHATRTKQSYTVHTMLGVLHDHTIENLYFKKHSGMAYRDIINEIAATHHRLGGGGIATDFGVGAVYNMLLREHKYINPLQHIIFGYSSLNATIAKPNGSELFNHLSLNRTETLTHLIQLLKSETPRIRYRAWDIEEPYLTDFMHIYRVIQTADLTGKKSFVYRRHGSKPDDAIHATNFAYSLIRLILGENLLIDPALQGEIRKNFSGFARNRRSAGARVVSG